MNETPNIDRLAREGMLFRNAFVTNAICAPSRATILTGKFGHLNGVRDNQTAFDGSQQVFPKLLQKEGYQTALIGKWHLRSDPAGFDHWEVLPGQGHYYNPELRTATDTARYTGYASDVITDRALRWLRGERDPARPFMLMYQHKAPHRYWDPGPERLDAYDDAEIKEPPTLFDDLSGHADAARLMTCTIREHLTERDLKLRFPERLTAEQRARWEAAYGAENEAFREASLEGKALTRWKYQRYIKDYLRTVASLDDSIGRLLRYLEENGLAENTVVVYTSDQGFFLGEHGWFDKRFMYEESLRIPLIVRWPGVVEAGAESEELVQNLDLAETLLDVAGAEVPSDMQGRSLVPLLRGEAPPGWRTSIYYRYYEFPYWCYVRRHEGVRTGRYKLIHYYRSGEWELFDLQEDPQETASVYDDPAYADVAERLKTELEHLREKYRIPEEGD